MQRESVAMNFRICIICCAISLAGCARDDGRKTFEFLKAEREIIDSAKTELKTYSNPQPPSPPVFPKGSNIGERLQAVKVYHAATDRYLNTLIQNGQQTERILNNTETKISRLDSSGVGENAIDLTKDYEQLFGDWVQVSVELEALAKLDQAKLRSSQQPKLIAPLIAGILDTAVTDNPVVGAGVLLKSVSNEIKQEIDRNQEAQSHFARLQETVATLKHDLGRVVTERSELITSYQAKYPKYAWKSLLPTTQNAE